MAQKKKEKVVTLFPDTIVVSYEDAGNFLNVAGVPNKPAEFDTDNVDDVKLAVYNLSHFVRVERTVKLIPVK